MSKEKNHQTQIATTSLVSSDDTSDIHLPKSKERKKSHTLSIIISRYKKEENERRESYVLHP